MAGRIPTFTGRLSLRMKPTRKTQRRPTSTRFPKSLVVVLIVLVLLPALIYSVYQMSALSEQEALIGQIYTQQLDVVLFSVNQYAWDVVSSWFGEINRSLLEGSTQGILDKLPELSGPSGTVHAVFVTDSMGSDVRVIHAPDEETDQRGISSLLSRNRATLERLFARSRTGYTPIESLPDTGSPSTVVLIKAGPRSHAPGLVGIVIDVKAFVDFVLAPKLSDAAGDEFLFVVTKGDDRQIVYATGGADVAGLRKFRSLWILPDYALGVRLQTGTIEELAADRFREAVALVIALNLLILVGTWFVFRLARREIELAQLKSDFIASVSHELRTPLSLIRMSAETLLLGRVRSAERADEHHQIIVRETDRLTRLVNNVLLFSRLESGKTQIELANADLRDIVRTIVEEYKPEFSRRGFTVDTLFSDRPLRTRLNAEAMTEAILNLLDNAMKFSREHRHLSVRTGERPGEVFVEVEDEGIGIAPNLHGKIFERFYRVSSSSQNQKRGSGLGLALVKQIVEMHHGHVELASEPGRGSTFRLVFPVTLEPPDSE